MDDHQYAIEGEIVDLKCLHDSAEKRKRQRELNKVLLKRNKETATMEEKRQQQELADALLSSAYIIDGDLQYSPYV